jgi:Rieske Fe-S protein
VRRRLALAALAGGAGLGCGRETLDRRLRVALAAGGGRQVVEYLGEPVEVVRDGDQAVARSLLCSHYGCRVEWRPQSRQYHCACHEGRFDEHGDPAAGPPTRPLRRLPVEVAGDVVLVGER